MARWIHFKEVFQMEGNCQNYEITLYKGNILRSYNEETLILVENLDMQKGKKNWKKELMWIYPSRYWQVK